MTLFRRGVGLSLAALVVLIGSGCSSPDEKAGDSAVAPVVINLPDKRQVTINGVPKRIVTLGGQWTDVALAFGVTPVAYSDFVQQQSGTPPPWYGDKVADVPAINPADADVVGAVAKLNPDLILAPGFSAQGGSFEALSKLAPTIDEVSGEQVDPWQDMVTLMGTILREPDKAKEIIGGVDAKIKDIVTANPGLKGKTYAFAYMYGADQISAFGDSSDGAGKLFTSLGLTVAPKLAAESARTKMPRFDISTENLSYLDADLLVIATSTPALQERLEGLPGYRNLRAVKNGSVALLSLASISGLNEPAPNAIPYVFDQMSVPIAAAAKG